MGKVNGQCQEFATFGAYAFYILGGSVIVELARTIVAVAHLAKHFFYQKTYEEARKQQEKEKFQDSREASQRRRNELRQKESERRKEVDEANKKAETTGSIKDKLAARWTSVKNAGARMIDNKKHQAQEKFQEIKEDLGGVEGEVTDLLVDTTTETANTAWKKELVRGLIGMIPVFGAAYQTYRDWTHGRKFKDCGVLGINNLRRAREGEALYDTAVGALYKGYRPLF